MLRCEWLKWTPFTQNSAHTHKTLCTRKACSTSTNHIWAQDKPHSIHKWGYQVCFTANVWASTHHPGSCHGTQLLPDLWYYNSLKKSSTWNAWDVPSWGGQYALQQVQQRFSAIHHNRSVDVDSWLHSHIYCQWMLSVWGHLKFIYSVPPRIIDT
jgi:hypothetical protein